MSHVFLHEAAHTVAAIDRAIGFTHVEIPAPRAWQEEHGGHLMLGGVHLVTTPSWTTSEQAIAGLEMALAGSVAEKGGFGHWLERGYAGDMQMWARAVGLTGSDSTTLREDIERVLGCSMGDVLRQTKAWVVEAYPRIARVVTALAGRPSSRTPERMEYGEGPWRLTEAEAKAVAGD